MALRLGDEAPNFTAETTEGTINFHEWLGNGWGILFSHPKDYTPVCTTELGTVAKITNDFNDLKGFIIDLRNCPGGDDSTAIMIINRFCDRPRTAFHRRTKTGPNEDDVTPLKTWYLEPEGESQFTGPIAVLICDSVFSGGEAFALAIRELPHVTLIGDHTNGIFSYELEKKLPNGWKYTLSYQKYFSADMICYEGKGVPADIELFNSKADIETGIDPLIMRALELFEADDQSGADQVR